MTQNNRKKSRKLLFQKLFSDCFTLNEEWSFNESFYDNTHTFSKDDEYINKMLKITKSNEYFYIHVIKKYSPKFSIEKMSIINLLPIYIALSEMFVLDEEIPWKVSVNEAVELAKTYWDDSTKKIVNWILNKVLEDYETLNDEYKNIENSITYSIFKNND